MRHLSLVSRLAFAAALLTLLFAPAMGSATELFDNTLSSCSTDNCSSLTLPGTILSFGPSAAVFTVDVFAASGECMRLDLSTMPASPIDLELVVVAPNGSVFRNDDRAGASDRRPLVKIGSTPNNGWYTVHIAQFNGSPISANFTLLYGRYSAGNHNCASPTAPVLTGASAKDDTTDNAAQAPRANEPGAE